MRTILGPEKPWPMGLLFGTICCSCLVFWAMDLLAREHPCPRPPCAGSLVVVWCVVVAELLCVLSCVVVCVVLWCVDAFSWVRPKFGRSPDSPPLSFSQLHSLPKWGFTRQPENSKRGNLRVPTFNNTTKIPRNHPKKGRENVNCGGRGNKSAKFGPLTLRGPPFGAPAFGTPAFGDPPRVSLPPDSPHCFWVVVCAVLLLILLLFLFVLLLLLLFVAAFGPPTTF